MTLQFKMNAERINGSKKTDAQTTLQLVGKYIEYFGNQIQISISLVLLKFYKC